MKHNFTIRQVNSPFEDTAFFVRNVYKKNAMLLDCGRIGGLTNAEVLSISDIFISHTHIDHFYGFDRILRGSIRADKRLRLFGPTGFVKNVMGKLNSYTWNLIQDYSLEIEAIELCESGRFTRGLFRAQNSFEPEIDTYTPATIDLGEGFTLDFRFFDHGIPSAGYRIREAGLITIQKETLSEKGYLPGPWLAELKNALKEGVDKERLLTVDTVSGKEERKIAQLEDEIVIHREPQDITFITDMAPTYDNFRKASLFAEKSTVLLIEAMFLKEDVLHAIEKRHMTLELSKEVFKTSDSKYVRFFHFAPRYDKMRGEFLKTLHAGLEGRVLS